LGKKRKKRGFSISIISNMFLLKPDDIQYLKNELLKRKPNIEVVQS